MQDITIGDCMKVLIKQNQTELARVFAKAFKVAGYFVIIAGALGDLNNDLRVSWYHFVCIRWH